LTVDVNPSEQKPLGADPSGGDDPPEDKEELIVGRSRGEQRGDGSYHGKITVIALDLSSFGPMTPIEYSVETNNGETKSGLLPANAFLQDLCGGCLQVGKADSSTTGSGSTNSFSIASARILGAVVLIGESDGNISGDSNCQTSRGSSRLAFVGSEEDGEILGQRGLEEGGIVEIGRSSAETRDCRDGTSTQSNQSTAFTDAFGISQQFDDECANGVPDRYSGDQSLGPFIGWLFCNADDTNGTGPNDVAQSTAPYGVREALMAQGCSEFKDGDSRAEGLEGCIKGTIAASESRAVRPPASATTQTPVTLPGQGQVLPEQQEVAPDEDADEEDEGEQATRGRAAGPGAGKPGVTKSAGLPFTGAELLVFVMGGAILLLAGTSLRRAAGELRPDA
jgi:hypothetical protein